MRAWKVVALLVTAGIAPSLGCSTTGTQAIPVEAGADATTAGDDASSEGGSDAGDEADASLPPCVPLVAAQLAPSKDCVFAGSCPEDCTLGTASAYACAVVPPVGDASPSPSYPSVFTAPIGIVNVIAAGTGEYPWDAAAFVSCGPLACVRWNLADHVGGTSAWAGDPCGDGGDDTEAWSCPPSAGVVPPVAGCFDTGALGSIGGPGTGVPQQNVWCCPGPTDAGTTTSDSAVAESGAEGGSPGDAAPDATGD
jgi:hypothetical protein